MFSLVELYILQITIPVVGILYQDGATIANMIKQFPVVNATINREYECWLQVISL